VLCIYFSFSRSAPQSAQPDSVLPIDLLSGSGHSAKELVHAEDSSFRSYVRGSFVRKVWLPVGANSYGFRYGLLQELVPVVFLSRRIKMVEFF
jgi:hypothetical protein